jgi:hypothetical protein
MPAVVGVAAAGPQVQHKAHASALAGEHGHLWLIFTWDGVGAMTAF